MKKEIMAMAAAALAALSAAGGAVCAAGEENAGLAVSAGGSATSIYDSNVWWDLYKMFKAKYLAENPGRSEFNPYYLTPAYGRYHSEHDDASLLCAYPYADDLFLYTWLDSSSVDPSDWDGKSIQVRYTNSTALSSDGSGFADGGTWKTATATLVSSDNYSDGSRSNWLGKWLLAGVNSVTSATADYRVKVDSIWLYEGSEYAEKLYVCKDTAAMKALFSAQIAALALAGYSFADIEGGWYAVKGTAASDVLRWDCGDDIQYAKTDSFKDLNYLYVQPDYIRIAKKLAALWLSGETGNYGSGLITKWDPSCYPEGSLSDGCYRNMKENTYCFFNAGETLYDGSFKEETIEKLQSVTYSYTKTSFTHHSSQTVYTGNQAYPDAPGGRVFQGLYDDSYLNGDAYFSDASTYRSPDLTVDAKYVSSTHVQTGSFLGWTWGYDYSAMGIVDCRGDTNVPSGDEYSGLKDFIVRNRSFDSDGDGAADKQYAWAFLADEDERTSATENFGTAVVASWWNNASKCHQVDDVAMLRLKFYDSDGKLFDLAAMDVNTPTTAVTSITGGKSFVLAPEWLRNAIDFLDRYKGILIAVAALIGFGILIVLGAYAWPFIKPIIDLIAYPFRKADAKRKKKGGEGK